MSGSFTVGALALAAREANAVGAVRLTLLPRRLEIELLRATTFSDGYVPAGLTRFVRFAVPYSAVRGLVRRERGVLLSLDPAVATPYNRFFLTHFTDLPLEVLASLHRRRSIARALAWIVPLPLAAWGASQVPAALVSGALGRVSLALVVAIASAAALSTLAAWVETGGPLSRQLRDALERKLSQRMGFEPASFHDTDPFDLPEVDPRDVDRPLLRLPPAATAAPQAPVELVAPAPIGAPPAAPPAPAPTLISREPAPVAPLAAPPPPVAPRAAPTAPELAAPASPELPAVAPARLPRPQRVRALTAALAVVSVIGALAGFRYVSGLRPAPRPQAASLPEAAEGPTPPAPVAPAAAPSAPSGEACSCARSDSPLWRTGLPVLTMLPIPRAKGGHTPDSIAPVVDEEGASRYDFDIAVVNNAAISLRDVRIVVTFARRNERGERVGATDRGLFWEGELGPARSVKWGVSGPGTELKIEMDERRLLGDIAPASADAFARLLAARQPAVRLHAAMMLAYLGDSRAHAAESLSGLSASDELTRARVVRAAAPLRLCEIDHAKDGTLSACAFNAGGDEVASSEVVEVVEAGAGRTARVTGALAPRSGRRVQLAGFGAEAEELSLREVR